MKNEIHKTDHLPDLKRIITYMVSDGTYRDSSGHLIQYEVPATIEFCTGIGKKKFVIEIHVEDPDTFIDSNGNKWVRAKE